MLFSGGGKKKKPKTEEERRQETETRFHNFINKCAKKEKDREIECVVDEHIAYILETIFRYAQNEVYIFTHGLDEAIFGEKNLILEAIKFLTDPEAKLKIVYKDPNLKENILNTKFIRNILIPLTKGRVEIWDASKNAQISQNDGYFWVNDRYDWAIGPEGVARSNRANFGDKYGGGIKTMIFNNLIATSVKVL